MTDYTDFDWTAKVVYSADGPKPQFPFENDKMKVVLAGLEPGQKIREHPEGLAVYTILEGEGTMLLDGERLEVAAGSVIITPQGAARGMEAKTRLAFLATRVS